MLEVMGVQGFLVLLVVTVCAQLSSGFKEDPEVHYNAVTLTIS